MFQDFVASCKLSYESAASFRELVINLRWESRSCGISHLINSKVVLYHAVVLHQVKVEPGGQ